MKLLPLLAIILVAVTSNAQWKQEDFIPLQKLTGTWMMNIKNGQLFEVWTLTDANTLTSKSYRVRGADTASLEKVALSITDSKITYTPTVPNQNQGQPVQFVLTKIDTSGYSFEKTEHDFPKRITYHIKNEKELEVTIDGETKNGYKKSVYAFTRQ